MKSFSQFRKNQYTEAAKSSHGMEALKCYLEVLRLNLKEAVALPDLMMENFVDQTEYRIFKSEDSKLNHKLIDLTTNYAINSLYEEILREAETIAVPQNTGGNPEAAKKALLTFKQQLLAKIKQLVGGLKQTVLGAVTQGRSTNDVEDDAGGPMSPMGNAGGSAGTPSVSSPESSSGSGPSAPAQAPARSAMDRPAYGTERPVDDKGFKPAAYGSLKPADGWLSGLRRTLVDPIMNSRPVKWLRQKWHGDKQRESIEAFFVESTSQIDVAFDNFEKDLVGWLDQNFASVAKTVGVELGTSQPVGPAPTASTASDPQRTTDPTAQAGPTGPDIPVNTDIGSAAATDPAVLTGDAPEIQDAGTPEAEQIKFNAYSNARKGLEAIGYDIHTTAGWGRGKKPTFSFDQIGKKDASGNPVLMSDLIKKMGRKESFNNIIKAIYGKLGGQHAETQTAAEMWSHIAEKLNGLSYDYSTKGIRDRLTDLILRFGAHENGAKLEPAQRHDEPEDDEEHPQAAAGEASPPQNAAAPAPQSPELEAPMSNDNSVQEVMDLIVSKLGKQEDTPENRALIKSKIEKYGLEEYMQKVTAVIEKVLASKGGSATPETAPATPEVAPEVAPEASPEAPMEAPKPEMAPEAPKAREEIPPPAPKGEKAVQFLQKLAKMHKGDNKNFYSDLSHYMIDRLEGIGLKENEIESALKAMKDAGEGHRDAELQQAWAGAALEILKHHKVDGALKDEKAADDELNQMIGDSSKEAKPIADTSSSGADKLKSMRSALMKKKKNESFAEYVKRANQALKENLSDDSNIQILRKKLFTPE